MSIGNKIENLDENKREEKAETRKVSESVVETVHIVRPNHLNGAERLFGGILMQWIDVEE